MKMHDNGSVSHKKSGSKSLKVHDWWKPVVILVILTLCVGLLVFFLGYDRDSAGKATETDFDSLLQASDTATARIEDKNDSSIITQGVCDVDGDGYDGPYDFCALPTDCDDNDERIYPSAPEICGDGQDQDCDGIDSSCIDAPSIMPDSGTYKGKITVSMESKENNIIRYTLDGSEPNAYSSKYDAPFDLDPGSDNRRIEGNIDVKEKFTISLWFNPRVAQEKTDNSILALIGNEKEWSFNLRYDKSGYLGFDVNTLIDGIGGKTMPVFISTQKGMPQGEWQHIAIAYEKSTITIYLNGNRLLSKDITEIYPTKILIVGGNGDDKPFFEGAIDDIRLFDYTLEDKDIWKIYGTSINNHITTVSVKAKAFNDKSESETTTRNYVLSLEYNTVPSCKAYIKEGENPGYQHVHQSNTIYLNPLNSGTFSVGAEVYSHLGVAQVLFPEVTSPGVTLEKSPFIHKYAWEKSFKPQDKAAITVWNSEGKSGECHFNVLPDASAPQGGSISYGSGGDLIIQTSKTATSFQNIVIRVGFDDESGIDYTSGILERAVCQDTVCNEPKDWKALYVSSSNSDIFTYKDEELIKNTCYTYRYSVSDNVGNSATYQTPRPVCISSAVIPQIIMNNSEINILNNITSNGSFRNLTLYSTYVRLVYPTLNTGRNLVISKNIQMRNNSLFVNSSEIPELDMEALITFYGVTYTNPIPYKNDKPCRSSECYNRALDSASKTYTMTVSGFSTYKIVQSYCGDGICSSDESCTICADDCGVCGRGSGGGSGNYRPPNNTNIIVNTSPNNPPSGNSTGPANNVRNQNPQVKTPDTGKPSPIGIRNENPPSDDNLDTVPNKNPFKLFALIGVSLAIIIIIIGSVMVVFSGRNPQENSAQRIEPNQQQVMQQTSQQATQYPENYAQNTKPAISTGQSVPQSQPVDRYAAYRLYLEKARSIGLSDDQIRQRLRLAKWNDTQIDNLLSLGNDKAS